MSSDRLHSARHAALSVVVTALILVFASAPDAAELERVSSGSWSPTPFVQSHVVDQSKRYFSLKDQGEFAAAYGLMSPTLKQTMTLNDYENLSESFNSVAGPVKQRKIGKITWYNNPEAASQPGIYARVDFSSSFRNIEMHCGFLIWHRNGTKPFSLMREEEAHIPNSLLERLEPDELVEMKGQLGCR